MADKHKGTCLSDGPTFSFKKASPASPPKRVHQEGAHARNCSTARKLLDLKNGSNSCGRKSLTGNLPMSEQKFQEVIHGEFFSMQRSWTYNNFKDGKNKTGNWKMKSKNFVAKKNQTKAS